MAHPPGTWNPHRRKKAKTRQRTSAKATFPITLRAVHHADACLLMMLNHHQGVAFWTEEPIALSAIGFVYSPHRRLFNNKRHVGSPLYFLSDKQFHESNRHQRQQSSYWHQTSHRPVVILPNLRRNLVPLPDGVIKPDEQ